MCMADRQARGKMRSRLVAVVGGAGFAVLMPNNSRGSIGYGQKFAEMNRADWGGADYKDVMAGVHDLLNRGIADGNRLGIAGWSYGGYMSEWGLRRRMSSRER